MHCFNDQLLKAAHIKRIAVTKHPLKEEGKSRRRQCHDGSLCIQKQPETVALKAAIRRSDLWGVSPSEKCSTFAQSALMSALINACHLTRCPVLTVTSCIEMGKNGALW